jgi:hypothetical protein
LFFGVVGVEGAFVQGFFGGFSYLAGGYAGGEASLETLEFC